MINIIDYNSLQNYIFPRLIGRNLIDTLPEDIVTIKYLDLYVVFPLVISLENGESETVYLSNRFLDSLRISSSRKQSREILFTNSIDNARRERPAVIKSISDGLPFLHQFIEDAEVPFYILSNQSGHFGASVLLYEDVLEQFATMTGEDFCIIPSSVHEVLLIPDSLRIGIFDLRQILDDVNTTVLHPLEILSSNIYRYVSGYGLYCY